MTIGIAILGAGRWGTHLVRNFSQHPQAKLMAVVDSSADRLATCREQFKLADDVVMATDWSAVRQLQGLEAVAIATPASTHYSLITDALSLGYHVLAEKPLTLDPQECLALSQLAQQQQRQLMVDHTYLFHPAVETGSQIVHSGTLGQLYYGYATRTNLGPVRQDVDALWDLAIHDIAIFNTWLDEIPIEVQATGKVWLQPQLRQEKTTISGLHDLVWITLKYPNGFQATIHVCWSNPDKQRRLGVVGSQGSLIFDEMLGDNSLTLQRGYFEQQEHCFIPAGLERETLKIEAAEPLAKVCDRFLNNIHSPEIAPRSSALVGAQFVQILTCLSQSLEQDGKVIRVPCLKS